LYHPASVRPLKPIFSLAAAKKPAKYAEKIIVIRSIDDYYGGFVDKN